MVIDSHFVTCPYCWAGFDTAVDVTAGNQDYYEDCPVCCNPIRFRIRVTGDDEPTVELEAMRDDQ